MIKLREIKAAPGGCNVVGVVTWQAREYLLDAVVDEPTVNDPVAFAAWAEAYLKWRHGVTATIAVPELSAWLTAVDAAKNFQGNQSWWPDAVGPDVYVSHRR